MFSVLTKNPNGLKVFVFYNKDKASLFFDIITKMEVSSMIGSKPPENANSIDDLLLNYVFATLNFNSIIEYDRIKTLLNTYPVSFSHK